MEPRFDKGTGDGNKPLKRRRNMNVIPAEAIVKGNPNQKISGVGKKDPCEKCDGTDCPPLEEAGITCMGTEGLKVIPDTGQHHCLECDGSYCSTQEVSCNSEE